MTSQGYPYQQPPPYPQQQGPPPPGWNVSGGQQPQYNPYYGQPQQQAQPVYIVPEQVASGGEYGGTPPTEPPKEYALGFDDASIRRGFIRKVFGIVTVQLVVVVAMIALFLFQSDCKTFVKEHRWVYLISYAVFLVTYIGLMCCESVRRSYPSNLVWVALLTLSIGYMTAMISSFHDVQVVLLAMAITCLSCFAVVLFSIQTKFDFTKFIGVVFVVSICLLIFGIFAIIVMTFTNIKTIYLVYAVLMALLLMVFLAIDIQMIMGGKKVELSPEESIFAAIQLFMDLVLIFWYILTIVGYCGGN